VGEQVVLGRIESWQAAGLIDGDTADRLRQAERRIVERATRPWSGVGAGEVFGYLGAAFILGAYYWLLLQIDPSGDGMVLGLGAAVLAVASLVGAGLFGRRDGLPARAAGLLALTAVNHAAIAGNALAMAAFGGPSTEPGVPSGVLVGSVAALAAAAIGRWTVSGLPSTIGLIAAIGIAGYALGVEVGTLVLGRPAVDFQAQPPPDTLRHVLLAAWSLILATGAILVGERELHTRDNFRAYHSAVARFGGSLIAVIGVATALITGFPAPVEPFVAAAAVLAVAAALGGLAQRSGSTAFVYPSALAVLIALTHLNASYVASDGNLGLALLLEGVALIVVGFLAGRARRFLARRHVVGVEDASAGQAEAVPAPSDG
jgi:hypothetical protein